MRILYACLLAGLFVLTGTVSADENMTLIESESSIKFLGTKPDGKEQPGGFKNFKVNVKLDSKNRAASTISIEIDAKSIFTKDEKLTNHLKSPDFFDVRKSTSSIEYTTLLSFELIISLTHGGVFP